MLWQPSLPDQYLEASDDELSARIEQRRKELGDDLLILGHHYQQDDVVRHADLTGDSLKLSQMAAEESARRGSKYIVFCGVHFMAETADILSADDVTVILPDLSAGCSMADMADYDDVVQAWEDIHRALGDDFSGRVIPITYVNSTAAIKAFVGEHGGACCTSTNARAVFKWALDGGTQPKRDDEAIKIIFLPDQHLGRNTAKSFGMRTDVDTQIDPSSGEPQTRIYSPKKDNGGLTDDEIRSADVLLWAGHCSVHKLFRPEHVDQARETFKDRGGVTVIVHPECSQEVVDVADQSGSTEMIIKTIRNARPGSNWFVGTEVHLVNRLANEARERGVNVHMLSDCQCMCTTMYRIDQAHLLWVLDGLAEGTVRNAIRVHPKAQELAVKALDRMLQHTQTASPTDAPARSQTQTV